MAEHIYLIVGEQQSGPYSSDQLAEMVRSGTAHATTPCWHEGLSEWSTVGAAFPELAPAAPAPVPSPPAAGGTTFEVITSSFYKMPKITLSSSAAIVEAGLMHYMVGHIEMTSQMPSVGGFIKSALTKEKMVRPRYEGTGELFLEPTFGEVNTLQISGDTWILDRGCFMACDPGVEIGMFTNKALTGLFGGEGFFQTQVTGHGTVLYHSPGPVERIDLRGETLTVDGSFAVARTGDLEFKVERATKGLLSSWTSGEGIVNTFRGHGSVMIAPVTNRFLTLLYQFGGIRSLISGMKRG
jgi:uncharacterized protein (AIM24 family)